MTAALWITGGVLMLLGLGLVSWGLIGDRSRVPRCRRCRYEMAGVGPTCPECGWVAADERSLTRPIVRRRMAAAGVVLIIVASVLGAHAEMSGRTNGWWSIAPRWLLIEGIALTDARTPHMELWERYRRLSWTDWNTTSEPHSERLAAVCRAKLIDNSRSPFVHMWSGITLTDLVRDRELVGSTLITLIEHEDDVVRMRAMRCLIDYERAWGPLSEPLTAALAHAATETNRPSAREALHRLESVDLLDPEVARDYLLSWDRIHDPEGASIETRIADVLWDMQHQSEPREHQRELLLALAEAPTASERLTWIANHFLDELGLR